MLQAPFTLNPARPRAVSNWLFAVAVLIVAIVMVGGITRLTESGLSITQWKPLSGIVPPLTHAEWMAEFANYQKIPEFQQVNPDMTLSGFKAIFFWEYLHRLLARAIGVAFALPLLWFAVKRQIPRGYAWRLVALLALGGLQGAIGWWMVKSGLSVRTDVSHIRLAVHLCTALVTLAGVVWTALDLRMLDRKPFVLPARFTPFAAGIVGLLFVQIVFGAFTAGLDAGHAAPSWPLMGNTVLPPGVAFLHPLGNLIDEPLVVQFIHRWLAFAAAAGLVVLAFRAAKAESRRSAYAVIALVCFQILLGIATLLSDVAIPIAVAHQVNAALLLIAATAAAHAIGKRTA